jgi:hypothetical protein
MLGTIGVLMGNYHARVVTELPSPILKQAAAPQKKESRKQGNLL